MLHFFFQSLCPSECVPFSFMLCYLQPFAFSKAICIIVRTQAQDNRYGKQPNNFAQGILIALIHSFFVFSVVSSFRSQDPKTTKKRNQTEIAPFSNSIIICNEYKAFRLISLINSLKSAVWIIVSIYIQLNRAGFDARLSESEREREDSRGEKSRQTKRDEV